ncbi:MAG: protein kinase, partial [Planctomycetota bacterium]|nr:protein kinase [Planctomycetota bacterium]
MSGTSKGQAGRPEGREESHAREATPPLGGGRPPHPISRTPGGFSPGLGTGGLTPLFQSASVQDLESDKLLQSAPRVALPDGRLVPSLGGIPLLSKLGFGGMGAVYFGIHPRLNVEVAVKVLSFQLAEQQPDVIQRFYREAQMAAQIKSPHLVSVLDVNEEKGLYYLVMEFVRGQSAGAHIRERARNRMAPLPEAVALDICIAATEGLAAAHVKGIVHRDIKPDNILIPRREGEESLAWGEAKLSDLGLARADLAGQSLTGSQSALGTPGYMAPEQIVDAKKAGKPADVFSMGATLYALLCGRPPFAGETMMEIILAALNRPHVPIHSMRPDVSHVTAALIDRCLDKDPSRRYVDAPALLAALKVCRSAVGEPEATVGRAIEQLTLLQQASEVGARLPHTPPSGPGPGGPPAGATATPATVHPPVLDGATPPTIPAGQLAGTRPASAVPRAGLFVAAFVGTLIVAGMLAAAAYIFLEYRQGTSGDVAGVAPGALTGSPVSGGLSGGGGSGPGSPEPPKAGGASEAPKTGTSDPAEKPVPGKPPPGAGQVSPAEAGVKTEPAKPPAADPLEEARRERLARYRDAISRAREAIEGGRLEEAGRAAREATDLAPGKAEEAEAAEMAARIARLARAAEYRAAMAEAAKVLESGDEDRLEEALAKAAGIFEKNLAGTREEETAARNLSERIRAALAARKEKLAVVEFEVEKGAPAWATGRGLATMIEQNTRGTFRVLDGAAVRKAMAEAGIVSPADLASREAVRRLAEKTGARLAVTGSVVAVGDGALVAAKLIRLDSGAIVQTADALAKDAESVPAAAAEIARMLTMSDAEKRRHIAETREYPRWIAEGRRLLTEGRLADATVAFTRALQANPTDEARALLKEVEEKSREQALAAEGKRRYEEAMAEGSRLLAAGDAAGAEAAYRRALAVPSFESDRRAKEGLEKARMAAATRPRTEPAGGPRKVAFDAAMAEARAAEVRARATDDRAEWERIAAACEKALGAGYEPGRAEAEALLAEVRARMSPRVYSEWPFSEEEAKKRQKETAARLGLPVEKTVMIDDAVPLELVLIPPGTFVMGSHEGEKDRDKKNEEQHEVVITKAFYMGKYEVTQAQYEKVMGRNPSENRGPNLPVECVSWKDAQEFVYKLNEKAKGHGVFRLPTEAEWEYCLLYTS